MPIPCEDLHPLLFLTKTLKSVLNASFTNMCQNTNILILSLLMACTSVKKHDCHLCPPGRIKMVIGDRPCNFAQVMSTATWIGSIDR